jgi:hypothetical protein
MELQNYLTITTPDAMNAIPNQSTPYPLAIRSRQVAPNHSTRSQDFDRIWVRAPRIVIVLLELEERDGAEPSTRGRVGRDPGWLAESA